MKGLILPSRYLNEDKTLLIRTPLVLHSQLPNYRYSLRGVVNIELRFILTTTPYPLS
jgi:hypothetical protein